METILFYFLTVLGLCGAIGVATAGTIIRAAVCLLFALISVAGFFALLDAEFLAAAQLIIFVGGVLVLLIFGVMLTARQQTSAYSIPRSQLLLAVSVAIALGLVLVAAISRSTLAADPLSADDYRVERFGQSLLGRNLLGFELLSILLLVVMIGAAYLARSRREKP